MPMLPPFSLWIWETTPITFPAASSSGPPELPRLTGASVWMTPLIVKLLGAVMERSSALTMPAVSERSSPKGLPIA